MSARLAQRPAAPDQDLTSFPQEPRTLDGVPRGLNQISAGGGHLSEHRRIRQRELATVVHAPRIPPRPGPKPTAVYRLATVSRTALSSVAWSACRVSGMRVSGLGRKAAVLRQQMVDKRAEHRTYVRRAGQDLPEVCDWTWPTP